LLHAARPKLSGRNRKTVVVATGALVVDTLAFEAQVNGTVMRMKPREFKLLAALAKNLGHAVTRERLLELAWDDPIQVDGERTVDVYILRIRLRSGCEGPHRDGAHRRLQTSEVPVAASAE